MQMQLPQIKTTVDVAATVVVGATLLDYLPKVAAGCSIIWFVVQFIIVYPVLKQRVKDMFKKGDK